MLLELFKIDFTGPTRPVFFTGKPIQNYKFTRFCIGFPVKNTLYYAPPWKKRVQKLFFKFIFPPNSIDFSWIPHYWSNFLGDHNILTRNAGVQENIKCVWGWDYNFTYNWEMGRVGLVYPPKNWDVHATLPFSRF